MGSILAGTSPSCWRICWEVLGSLHNDSFVGIFDLFSLSLERASRHPLYRRKGRLGQENPEEVLLDTDNFSVTTALNLNTTLVSSCHFQYRPEVVLLTFLRSSVIVSGKL